VYAEVVLAIRCVRRGRSGFAADAVLGSAWLPHSCLKTSLLSEHACFELGPDHGGLQDQRPVILPRTRYQDWRPTLPEAGSSPALL